MISVPKLMQRNPWKVAILFLIAPLFAETANAQSFFDDDEPSMEEIVTTAPRIGDRGYLGFSSVLEFLEFREATMINWVAQLNDILDAAIDTLANVDVEQVCNEQQSEFRGMCLQAAHNNLLLCGAGGFLLTGGAAGLSGGTLATIVGGGAGVYCTDSNFDAVNACNYAADNFSFPGAHLQCTAGE